MALKKYFSGKRVLVTGGCGTVGSELVNQLVKQDLAELRIIDNSEDGVFATEQLYSNSNVYTLIGDIRDEYRVNEIVDGTDIIFHTAALKHVQICERAPADAVMTNIIGTQNIIRSAIRHKVKKCILTSTDKAVNPTNVMGTSKLMAERLVTAANNYSHTGDTLLASTRFGNVLASRGSVVRIFYEQIKSGGPVTVTDTAMSRFIMTIDESVRLILAAALLANGGEIFIPKMPIIRVIDLAHAMINLIAPKFDRKPDDVEIKIIGPRLGESIHEELMTVEESVRAFELDDLFAVFPAKGTLSREIKYSYQGTVKECDKDGYNSKNGPFMSVDDISKYLLETKILECLSG